MPSQDKKMHLQSQARLPMQPILAVPQLAKQIVTQRLSNENALSRMNPTDAAKQLTPQMPTTKICNCTAPCNCSVTKTAEQQMHAVVQAALPLTHTLIQPQTLLQTAAPSSAPQTTHINIPRNIAPMTHITVSAASTTQHPHTAAMSNIAVQNTAPISQTVVSSATGSFTALLQLAKVSLLFH